MTGTRRADLVSVPPDPTVAEVVMTDVDHEQAPVRPAPPAKPQRPSSAGPATGTAARAARRAGSSPAGSPRPPKPERASGSSTRVGRGDRPVHADRHPLGHPIDPAAGRKGLIVAVVTAMLSVFIFWAGLDKSDAVDETPPTTAIAPTTEAPPTTLPPPPTTRVLAKDLKVIVGNGVDKQKALALPVANKLKDAGYPNPRSVDLATTFDRSVVLAAPELRGEAIAVAKALGWPETAVADMPNPPPFAMGEWRVLAVIGRDRAT